MGVTDGNGLTDAEIEHAERQMADLIRHREEQQPFHTGGNAPAPIVTATLDDISRHLVTICERLSYILDRLDEIVDRR